MDINTHFSTQLHWIKQHITPASITPIAGDAGFRRYYRIIDVNNQPFIFLDASKDAKSFQAYYLQSKHLATYKLPIPKIIVHDQKKHYAILTDFGDDLLFNRLTSDNAQTCYQLALETLFQFHQCEIQTFGNFPILNAPLMQEELLGFQEWYLEKYLKKTLDVTTKENLSRCFDLIIHHVVKQPYVFIHRDYHSKNIFLLDHPNQSSSNKNRILAESKTIGLIDFQDAMAGPVTYDIVSLLRDCYVSLLDNATVKKLALYYKVNNNSLKNMSDAAFIHYFDYTGLQRHLKAICTFARKSVRDNDHNYLQFIPNTLNYITVVASHYSELTFLTDYIRELQ